MEVTFVPYVESDQAELVQWVSSETWEYFETPSPSLDDVLKWCSSGYFHGENSLSFWINSTGGEHVGLIAVFDVHDPIPRIELRIRKAYRQLGIGRKALRWITDFVFTNYTKALRIEGNTRQDNIAMRRTFTTCGWVKEAHYRNLWRTVTGEYLSCIGYAVIRQDWLNGTVTPVEWNDESPVISKIKL